MLLNTESVINETALLVYLDPVCAVDMPDFEYMPRRLCVYPDVTLSFAGEKSPLEARHRDCNRKASNQTNC